MRTEQLSVRKWRLRSPGRKATSTQWPKTWHPKGESPVANVERFRESKSQQRRLRQSLPQMSTMLWKWEFPAAAAVDKSHAISRNTHGPGDDRTRDSRANHHTAPACKTASEAITKQQRGQSAPKGFEKSISSGKLRRAARQMRSDIFSSKPRTRRKKHR